MQPNITIGNLLIPSWYALLITGVVISTALAVYCIPKDFSISRKEFFLLALIIIAMSLLGARLLFLVLHYNISNIQLKDILSLKGGFAYFGALIFAIITLFAYSAIRKIRALILVDYIMPFLMLSQAFVRVGCLMAGCCYGKPATPMFGLIFKTVDKIPRYPTQAYEAILLIATYLISRIIYIEKKDVIGYTFAVSLVMYGLGRFFIEFLRIDSPAIFLNITLAQATCIIVFMIGIFLLIHTKKRQARL